MTQPEKQDPGRKEEPGEPWEGNIVGREPAGETSAQSLRMIYEDELRKACGVRALEPKIERNWQAFRKSLPINRWIERSQAAKSSKAQTKKLLEELEHYLEIFSAEADKAGLRLDMERNYYREAINLLGKFPQGAGLGTQEEQRLTELMIMVDFKDARLALQILKSIV